MNQLKQFLTKHNTRILQGLYTILLFMVMILGMIAKVVYDNLAKNEAPPELGWGILGKADVLLAIVVSPMIFGAIYSLVQNTPKGLGAVIFAFQNGFFWKTIFGSLDAPTAFVK